jgi:hypothetical protein
MATFILPDLTWLGQVLPRESIRKLLCVCVWGGGGLIQPHSFHCLLAFLEAKGFPIENIYQTSLYYSAIHTSKAYF